MRSNKAIKPAVADDRPPIEAFDPWEQKFKSHLRPVKIEPAQPVETPEN